MKTFFYKKYWVMLERQHNGSIRAVADNDIDRFNRVFYGYSQTEAIKRIKAECSERLQEAV